MRVFSFQKRLLFGVLLLVFTTTATLGFVGGRYGALFLRNRFEDRMNFLARYLALNAELGIILGDKNMLESFAENLMEESDVAEVWIEDRDGNILVRTGSGEAGRTKEAVAPVWLRQQEEDLVFMDTPVTDRLLGTVHLIYTTSGITDLMKRLRNIYILAAIILSAMGLFAFSLFSRSLVAPLKVLVDAAEKVAQGDFDIKVKGGGIPEISSLADAFNNMLTALAQSRNALELAYQEMIQQKTMAEVGQFAFTVAHEVKNPLGIIKGALDVLKKAEVSDETRMTMIQYMDEEILRLDRIIQDFLTFSRPRKPSFRDLEMNAMIETLVDKNRLEWESRGVELCVDMTDDRCMVVADEDYLAQAVLNIVRNACEACDGQGKVCIRIECAGDSWVIEVSDTGKGMDEETMRRVAEPFFTTKASGTGLGVALVERVVKLHGGDMIFSSNKNGGTTVRIVIPQ